MCRTDMLRFFFCNRICTVWNSLPLDVVNAPSVNSFKKRVSKFNLDRFLTLKWFYFINRSIKIYQQHFVIIVLVILLMMSLCIYFQWHYWFYFAVFCSDMHGWIFIFCITCILFKLDFYYFWGGILVAGYSSLCLACFILVLSFIDLCFLWTMEWTNK